MIEQSPVFTEGDAAGAVLATLATDDIAAQNRIQVDLLWGRLGM